MRNLILLISILSLGQLFCGQKSNSGAHDKKGAVRIEWTDDVAGDFSFRGKWSYPEGVYKNAFGQLSCDGFCPEGVDAMKDSAGRILDDSLEAFYRFVDTSHQYNSIKSEAWCYEWAGTDYCVALRKSKDSVICFTLTNSGTHCSLKMTFTKGVCYPEIELNSIASAGNKTWTCSGGRLRIDSDFWKKGVLKAVFDFQFDHAENPGRPMYWKGNIYTTIERADQARPEI